MHVAESAPLHVGILTRYDVQMSQTSFQLGLYVSKGSQIVVLKSLIPVNVLVSRTMKFAIHLTRVVFSLLVVSYSMTRFAFAWSNVEQT